MPGAATRPQMYEETESGSTHEQEMVTPGAVLSDFEQICVGMSVSGALIAVRELTGLRCTVSFGKAPAVSSRLAGDGAFTMRCVESDEVVVCDDAAADPRFGPLVANRLGFRSAVAVPIEAQGSVVGVVELFCPEANAISEGAVADLKRVAKSYATLMVFDAANGGEAIVGGSLEEPIELPRLVDDQATASVESSTGSAENPSAQAAEGGGQAGKVEEPASGERVEPGEQAKSGEQVQTAEAELVGYDIKRSRISKAPAMTINVMATPETTAPAATAKVHSLSKLPSDRRTPSRVWLIAGALLFALSLLLLLLYMSGSRRSSATTESQGRSSELSLRALNALIVRVRS